MKSDDVVGRVKTYEAIVKGANIPDPGVPESFKVLVKELQSLALDIKVYGEDHELIEIKELEEDTVNESEYKEQLTETLPEDEIPADEEESFDFDSLDLGGDLDDDLFGDELE